MLLKLSASWKVLVTEASIFGCFMLKILSERLAKACT